MSMSTQDEIKKNILVKRKIVLNTVLYMVRQKIFIKKIFHMLHNINVCCRSCKLLSVNRLLNYMRVNQRIWNNFGLGFKNNNMKVNQYTRNDNYLNTTFVTTVKKKCIELREKGFDTSSFQLYCGFEAGCKYKVKDRFCRHKCEKNTNVCKYHTDREYKLSLGIQTIFPKDISGIISKFVIDPLR